jgi:hypothetical protein
MAVAKAKGTRVLAFDPTPAGLVTRPLHKAYKTVWASLRGKLLKQHGAVCQICKHVAEAQRHIHCHEVYAYPNKRVVRLKRVVLLCWRCHDAVHFERTRSRCGQKYVDEIAAHYRSVNGGLSSKEFERDLQETFRRMLDIRQRYGGPAAEPDIDYGLYADLVSDYHWRRGDDDFGFEMFPDHECPWDIAMLRQ